VLREVRSVTWLQEMAFLLDLEREWFFPGELLRTIDISILVLSIP
jgi:hypothetical protein